jgi:hypothetical protein
MTKLENMQRLNKILRIYDKSFDNYDRYDEGTYAEQREYMVQNIIDNYKAELKEIKGK